MLMHITEELAHQQSSIPVRPHIKLERCLSTSFILQVSSLHPKTPVQRLAASWHHNLCKIWNGHGKGIWRYVYIIISGLSGMLLARSSMWFVIVQCRKIETHNRWCQLHTISDLCVHKVIFGQ